MALRRVRGRVYLVGAGPGDPALITRRGHALLARADVVVYDSTLVAPALLDAAPARAERIAAGRIAGRRVLPQRAVNRILVDRARRGLTVVRIKGGDPGLFARAGEEAEALAAARVPFEIVPGVTAALGAAAAAGIPLTDRRLASAVVLATGHDDPARKGGGPDWSALAAAGTIAVYMGVARLRAIAGALLAAGRPPATPVLLVRWAGRPDAVVVEGTLGGIADRAAAVRMAPPAVLIVGEVARLRRRLDWPGRRPLRGRTIVVTRARDQAAALTDALAEQGARVLEAPAIALAPPRTFAPLDRALDRLRRYDLAVFTSANGVTRFFERLRDRRVDIRDLRAPVVAIGPATAAAVEAQGLRVAVVPAEYRAEGIVAALARRGGRRNAAGLRLGPGARVLIPRAAVARDLLVRALRRRGAVVDVVPVYRTVPSRAGLREVTEALRAGRIDLLTFASSSAVAAFASRFPAPGDRRRLRRVPVAAIGPITARAARAAGFRVALTPRAYTIPALVDAIVRRLRSSPSGTPRAS
jgi:uroporphyrinogen III methyltransferase/synthase